MKLKTVFIRFYKSFNYDYLRKVHRDAKPKPWEYMDKLWYPYVRIPIDPLVTTVVGANESGKSHLLSAIKKGIAGQNIAREDLCRYSQFFTVERGKLRLPDFGFEWTDMTPEEREVLQAVCGLSSRKVVSSYLVFRTNGNTVTIYLPHEGGYKEYPLDSQAAAKVAGNAPHVFEIDANVALPDSISIRQLAEAADEVNTNWIEGLGRQGRFGLFDGVRNVMQHLASPESVTAGAGQIVSTFSPYRTGDPGGLKGDRATNERKQLDLARKLVLKVANIAPEAFLDLYNAIRDGKDGHANGLIQQINVNLAAALNFPRWWVQDRDFQLRVSAREFELVFTICDKTGTEYSFAERSSGLKYFLSYFVQFRSHEQEGVRPEILLMDEPDAYLSSEAQQDLLKIFQAFAVPDDGRQPVQVIYVTHSPFLIDKNHSERIRVLEKGVGEEGTRVVKDASRNHYEPLRSAFGAFVGETTFIGNCNIIVEGPADQILLAGVATHLRAQGTSNLETLDLNHITLVPAGSASHVPYLVYLARGRDIEQPAVVVLLDSDAAGNTAKKDLERGVLRKKQLLKPNFILQVGDLADEVTSLQRLVAIEDLVPLALCVEAAKMFAVQIGDAEPSIVAAITEDAVRAKSVADKSIFVATEACLLEVSGGELHLDKVGFARIVVDMLAKDKGEGPVGEALMVLQANMKVLFRRLDKMRREAERELAQDRIARKVDRAKKSFLQDHPNGAKREEAIVLLDELEASLDERAESDSAKQAILNLRRQFNLDIDMTKLVDNYAEFQAGLELVKYAGRIASQASDSLEIAG